jgi:outer membrane protein OmpA-like peptidoglycan-associated protein
VHPARVPVAGSPASYDRGANLPSPPPGPIESRLLPIPEGTNLRVPRDYGQPPAQSAAAAPSSPISPDIPVAPPAVSPGGPLAVIPFVGQSANLTDATKAALESVAKQIADKRIRHIELRAFAVGGDLDSRKVALARALVVRSYLIDLKVKARIEVGSFAGDGQQVEILVPNT